MNRISRLFLALSVPSALVLVVACGQKATEETTKTRETTGKGQSAMQIEVLTIPGCQVTPPTVELVKATADESGVAYDLSIVTIESHKEANDANFIGSPSVRVNGEDVEPGAHLQEQYGVT